MPAVIKTCYELYIQTNKVRDYVYQSTVPEVRNHVINHWHVLRFWVPKGDLPSNSLRIHSFSFSTSVYEHPHGSKHIYSHWVTKMNGTWAQALQSGEGDWQGIG